MVREQEASVVPQLLLRLRVGRAGSAARGLLLQLAHQRLLLRPQLWGEARADHGPEQAEEEVESRGDVHSRPRSDAHLGASVPQHPDGALQRRPDPVRHVEPGLLGPAGDAEAFEAGEARRREFDPEPPLLQRVRGDHQPENGVEVLGAPGEGAVNRHIRHAEAGHGGVALRRGGAERGLVAE